VRCPRCDAEVGARALRCGRCALPLGWPADPAPRPLAVDIHLDRRARARGPAEALAEAPAEQAADFAVDEATLEIHLPRAPALRRAASWAVDAVLIAAAAAAPLALAARSLAPGADPLEALGPPAAALVALLGFSYATLAHALMGATAGKRLLGLRVVGPDGRAPSIGRSGVRAAVAVVGAGALGLPILAALFTRRGRALHDVAARTAVVRAP